MSTTIKTTKGGSKLSRSEVTTVRLDPKLRYLAELASRKQRRTLSSYIEWAVETSLRDVNLYEGTNYNGDDSITVAAEASMLWDVDESERFIKLAINYPELLTHEEQERWKMLSDSELLAPAKKRGRQGKIEWNNAVLDDEIYPAVRRHWLSLVKAHEGGVESQREWVSSIKSDVRNGGVYFGYPPSKGLPSPFEDPDDISF